MPNLSAVDWLVMLLYCTTVLGIGLSLKPFTTTAKDYFLAGRAQPAWICALGMVAASLGAPEVLTMAATGAHYGLAAACFFTLGSVPALIFLAYWLMPVYYASGARTIPEFLRLRFGRPTALLHAWLYVAMALFTAGLSLYLMATVFQAIHVFDRFFASFSWYQHSSFAVLVALSILLVAAYLLQGGLAGTLYSQTVQLALLVAGLLPVVYLGLRGVGGWSGLRAALPATSGPSGCLIALGLGFVFAAGSWCVDLRVLQAAFAAKDAPTARRVPLFAAVLRLFVPLLLIVPGIVAIGMPTPHTVINVTTTSDGSIIHTIDVVPPATAAGHGLVPAILDPVTRQPLHDAAGHVQLDYIGALPGILVHFLPTGLLGLALAALLACCMSGLAANITAIGAVFSIDLFPVNAADPVPEACASDAADLRSILKGRVSAAVALAIASGLAYLLHAFISPIPVLLLVFAMVNIPVLVVVLLGVFWPRATAPGAFSGVVAGLLAALACYGLTRPEGVTRGLAGVWVAALSRPSGTLSAGFGAALAASMVSLIVMLAVSLVTASKPTAELAGPARSAVKERVRPERTSINLDVRLPMGLMFTLTGAFLGAFGFSTRDSTIYSTSLGFNVNRAWGLILLAVGVGMFIAGRHGQLEIEKQRPQPPTFRK